MPPVSSLPPQPAVRFGRSSRPEEITWIKDAVKAATPANSPFWDVMELPPDLFRDQVLETQAHFFSYDLSLKSMLGGLFVDQRKIKSGDPVVRLYKTKPGKSLIEAFKKKMGQWLLLDSTRNLYAVRQDLRKPENWYGIYSLVLQPEPDTLIEVNIPNFTATSKLKRRFEASESL